MSTFLSNQDAQEKIISGAKKLVDVVKQTIGPKGRNAVLDRKFSTPLITNDGVTIAKSITLADEYENMGAKLLKQVCQKTNEIAGDGTTTALVLAEKLLREGFRKINNGESPIIINKNLKFAKDQAISLLQKLARPIKDETDIENIATISSQDKDVGFLIARAYAITKQTSSITLQDSKSAKTELVFQEGLEFPSGLYCPSIATNLEKGLSDYDNALLFLTSNKISTFNSILPILEKVVKLNRPLVLICEDIEPEALNNIIINKLRHTFDCTVVRAPYYGEKKLEVLRDIACFTGATICDNLSTFEENMFGELKHVKITRQNTILIPKNLGNEKLSNRISALKQKLEMSSGIEKEELKDRLSKLSGSIATIMVGGTTDIEQQERKLRIEDAINATSVALEGGIVAGGGVALLRVAKSLRKTRNITSEQKLGFDLLISALEEPIRQILVNADLEPNAIISKILGSESDVFGYDAMEEKFCNMLSRGIIDPERVEQTAIENAVSVATTMLTTVALVQAE